MLQRGVQGVNYFAVDEAPQFVSQLSSRVYLGLAINDDSWQLVCAH